MRPSLKFPSENHDFEGFEQALSFRIHNSNIGNKNNRDTPLTLIKENPGVSFDNKNKTNTDTSSSKEYKSGNHLWYMQ